jgi:hypothetical protein
MANEMNANVISVNVRSINGLIDQIQAFDPVAANSLRSSIRPDASPADLGRVYAQASAVLRSHYSGKPGMTLPAGARLAPTAYDREGLAFVREIASPGVNLESRARDQDFNRIGALMVG